jgi:predicted peptidase
MPQQPHHFETPITHSLGYLVHLPPGYGEDATRRWPLILFLHGIGERGSDVEKVKIHGIAKIVEEQPGFPFVAVSPQCPAGSSWWPHEVEPLKALLDHILATHAVDPTRVYLTGLSMGGYGVWALGSAYPDLFAAIAPICGGGDVDTVCALKDVPVWAFHGDLDTVVLLSESQKLVDALQACGGNVQLTIYPGIKHDSWTQTYDNPALYQWFMSHSRAASVE